MAQILNFKKLEVTGATKEEALAKAPFDIMGDATQAYKNWAKKQVNGITESDKKQFMLDYLNKKSKNVSGVGFSITVDSAVPDTRERPYRIEDVKNENGDRKYTTVYQFIDDATGTIVGETPIEKVQKVDKDGRPVLNPDGTPKMVWKSATKAEAKRMAKELYIDGYTGNLTCKYTKQVAEGEATAFKVSYSPSKSCKQGSYVVFGIERP